MNSSHPTSTPAPSGQRLPTECRAALAVSGFSLVVHLATLAPTVTSEDSGELITAAARWGVAHPPGYPLYGLIGSLFALVPVGSVAYRLNFMSAVFAAITCGLVVLLTRRLGASLAAAAAAGAALAVARSFWQQSVIAEVYTLHTALLAGLLGSSLALGRDPTPSGARLFAGLLGLALANHYPLTLLMLPPLVAYVALPWTSARLSLLARASPLIIPGCLLYGYLLIAARLSPSLSWADTSSLDGLIAHVSRRAYRSREFDGSWTWSDKWAYLSDFASLLGAQWTWPALLLIAVGAATARLRERALLLAMAAMGSIGLILLHRYPLDAENRGRMDEWYVPVYVVLAPLLGLGLTRAAAWLEVRFVKPKLSPWLLCTFPILPLWYNASVANHRDDLVAHDFARAALRLVPPRSVFFTSGDYSTFPALYLQAVEGVRSDVVLGSISGGPSPQAVELARQIDPQVDGHDIGAVQAALLRGDRPLMIASRSELKVSGLQSTLWGLSYRVWRPGEPSGEAPDLRHEAVFSTVSPRAVDDLERSLLGDHQLFLAEAYMSHRQTSEARAALNEAARWYASSKEGLNNLGGTAAELGVVDVAEQALRSAAAMSPHYLTPRRNLAYLLERHGRRDESLALWREVARIQPNDPTARARLQPPSVAPEEASWREAIEQAPNNPAAWNNLGSWLAERGRTSEASQAYQRALALDPDYGVARRNLARLGPARGESSTSVP